MSIRGGRRYLRRAVDQDGDMLDILVQKRKDKQAAKRFFRKFPKAPVPLDITSDKLPSYGAAKKEVMPSVAHWKDKYANNRAEESHEHTREPARAVHRCRSPAVLGTHLGEGSSTNGLASPATSLARRASSFSSSSSRRRKPARTISLTDWNRPSAIFSLTKASK
jgi:transposase-like protein